MRCVKPSAICVLAIVLTLATASQPQAQETGTGKRIALLVGVNKYEKRGFRNLDYAERDVEELAKILRQAAYEVYMLRGSAPPRQRATSTNIQNAIEAVLRGRTKRDLVLVALAGHGLQVEVAGSDGRRRTESFFCPSDAQRGNPKTMLGISSLISEIDRRGGGWNLVLVDACREDPTRGRGLDGSTVKVPEGVAVLFGCRSGQRTFESVRAGGGHGVFFHYVLEGLRGQAKNRSGDVTWATLAEYVSERVPNEIPRLIDGNAVRQTPNLIANLPGRSPVVMPRRLNPAQIIAENLDESQEPAVIVRIDASTLRLAHILKRLERLQFNLPDMPDLREAEKADKGIRLFVATGLQETYVFVIPPHTDPLLMLTGRRDLSVLAELLRGSAKAKLSVRLMHRQGVVLAGPEAIVSRLQPPDRPVSRRDVTDAFVAAGGGPVQALMFNTAGMRHEILKKIPPRLPKELGSGPTKPLVDSVRFIAIGIDASPELTARLVVQSKDHGNAKSLHALVVTIADQLRKNPNAQRDWPEIGRASRILTPKLVKNRLVLELNEKNEGVAALASLVRAIGRAMSRQKKK